MSVYRSSVRPDPIDAGLLATDNPFFEIDTDIADKCSADLPDFLAADFNSMSSATKAKRLLAAPEKPPGAVFVVDHRLSRIYWIRIDIYHTISFLPVYAR